MQKFQIRNKANKAGTSTAPQGWMLCEYQGYLTKPFDFWGHCYDENLLFFLLKPMPFDPLFQSSFCLISFLNEILLL